MICNPGSNVVIGDAPGCTDVDRTSKFDRAEAALGTPIEDLDVTGVIGLAAHHDTFVKGVGSVGDDYTCWYMHWVDND